MSIKILQCMFGKGKGGMEQVFVDHTRALAECGYKVYNACHAKSPYISEIEQITSTEIFTFTGTKKHYPMIYPAMIKTVKQIQPEIIFLHGNRAISLLTNPLVKKLLPENVKLAATTHNYRNKLFNRLDYCLAITDDLKKDLIKRKISEDRIFYCPNGVKLKRFKELFYHNPPTIGALGRMHTVKGYDIFLKACKLLKDNNVKFQAVIGGDGKELKSLNSLLHYLKLENSVTLKGWINDKENFFDEIDIFCLPSRNESLGISLLEAMSYSKPCVVTRCKGPEEAVSKYNSGIIVDKENPPKLYNALKSILNDQKQAKSFAKNSWATVNEVYSFEKLKSRLKGICEKISSHNPTKTG